MAVIAAIIIGFFVGLIARFLKPGRDKMGFVLTTLLGIAGALFGGFLGRAVGVYQPDEPAGFFASVIGAILLLAIVQFFTRRRTT